ncbi:hypothetical protein K9M74_01115 [Candidatus Woesearchaeota archaeon]|nr:hypothetical protein [Candidatus Woesearchaeota archaeon]
MEVDTSFVAKAIKSRNSYMLWIPKTEAEFLNIDKGSFVKIGIKKVKQKNK